MVLGRVVLNILVIRDFDLILLAFMCLGNLFLFLL